MNFEDMPERHQRWIMELKHGSITIQCDVNDCVEKANNWPDAVENIISSMDDLIGEAEGVKSKIKGDG